MYSVPSLPGCWNFSIPDKKMLPLVDNTLAMVLCHVADSVRRAGN